MKIAIPRKSVARGVIRSFVGITGIPWSVIFNPRNRLRLGKYVEARRYTVAFFSGSYLESWRRQAGPAEGEAEAAGGARRRGRGRKPWTKKKPKMKGILEEITRSKGDMGAESNGARVNRGFYKNYPPACGRSRMPAAANWIERIHLSSRELSTRTISRWDLPFNNDSFVATEPRLHPPPRPTLLLALPSRQPSPWHAASAREVMRRWTEAFAGRKCEGRRSGIEREA